MEMWERRDVRSLKNDNFGSGVPVRVVAQLPIHFLHSGTISFETIERGVVEPARTWRRADANADTVAQINGGLSGPSPGVIVPLSQLLHVYPWGSSKWPTESGRKNSNRLPPPEAKAFIGSNPIPSELFIHDLNQFGAVP